MLTKQQLEDGTRNVIAGILETAIADYMTALKTNNTGEIISLEQFFMSEWGQSLSSFNGETIIERCKQNFQKTY